MANKKFKLIIALVLIIFIGLSTKCGTNTANLRTGMLNKPIDKELYYENYQLVLIKYFY